jgi:hypothetical protein
MRIRAATKKGFSSHERSQENRLTLDIPPLKACDWRKEMNEKEMDHWINWFIMETVFYIEIMRPRY